MHTRRITLALIAVAGLAGCEAQSDTGPIDGGADASHDVSVSNDARGDVAVVDVPVRMPQSDGDGDTIGDGDEGASLGIDTDHDGTPDAADTDSDGDGFTDAQEAGDTDTATLPVDTDMDGTPDYRDLDSDGDGLADASEHERGTDPTRSDSDGDGVADLAEVVAMTSPTDATSNPRANGDFYFTIPYNADPSPPRDTLVFGTALQRADVHFAIDTSVSMQSYIDRVRSGLRTTIIPSVAATIPDVEMGVGQFDSCPGASLETTYGTCVGVRFEQGSTSDLTAVDSALGRLTADCGPVHESYAQITWLWATGDRMHYPTAMLSTCAAGRVGGNCLRPDALPVLVMIGDEPFSESYNTRGMPCSLDSCASCATFPSVTDIVSALNAIHAKIVVLGPAGTSPQWGQIAMGTGSVDAMGAPLVFPDTTATDVDMRVASAISTLAGSTPRRVSARARDLDNDGIDSTSFIARLEANTTGGVADPRNPMRVCVGGLATEDANGDGVPEVFPNVTGGAAVCFDIVPRMNTTVPPTDRPQVFRAAIDVIGDDITVLDTREVYFLVPPIEGVPLPG